MKICLTVLDYSVADHTTVPLLLGQDIVSQVDNCAIDGECTSIIAEDVLDYLSMEDWHNFITVLCRKLHSNGHLVISAKDPFELANLLMKRVLIYEDLNKMLNKRPRPSLFLPMEILCWHPSFRVLKLVHRRWDNDKYICVYHKEQH
jgi:hypothetical protein